MTDDDEKKHVLDLRMSKDKQRKLFKDPKVSEFLNSRKYRVTIKDGHKTRYIYGDDPVIIEGFARAKGLIILRTEEL